MQTQKMSLANIQGKLSRSEMKNIMAGSGSCYSCNSSNGGSSCWYSSSANSWTLCQRVYPGTTTLTLLLNSCNGCTMN